MILTINVILIVIIIRVILPLLLSVSFLFSLLFFLLSLAIFRIQGSTAISISWIFRLNS